MCGQGNDRCPIHALFSFIFSDLARGFETSHDWHLNIHQNDIVPTLLDRFYGFQTIADDRDIVLVLLQDLDGQFLVDVVVFGQENVERPGVVSGDRCRPSFQSREHAISEIDRLTRGGHVGTDTQIQGRLETDADQGTHQNDRNVLEVVECTEQPCRGYRVHNDDIVRVTRLLARRILDFGRRNVLIVADDQWFQVDGLEHLQHIIGLEAVLALVDEEDPVVLVRHELGGNDTQ